MSVPIVAAICLLICSLMWSPPPRRRPGDVDCDACNGTGAPRGYSESVWLGACSRCDGRGWLRGAAP